MNPGITHISKAVLDGGQIRHTVAFTVQLAAIPHDDPIAFAMGFLAGCAGDPLVREGERKSDLAKAYLIGYRLGWGVKAGKIPMPVWAKPQDTKEVGA